MHRRDGIAQLIWRSDIHRPFLREAVRPIAADPLPLKSLYVLHDAEVLVVRLFHEEAVVLDDGLFLSESLVSGHILRSRTRGQSQCERQRCEQNSHEKRKELGRIVGFEPTTAGATD